MTFVLLGVPHEEGCIRWTHPERGCDCILSHEVVLALALHCSEQEERVAELDLLWRLDAQAHEEWCHRAKKAEARCEELEAALAEYADPKNWAVRRDFTSLFPSCVWIGLDNDGPAIARATLTPTVETNAAEAFRSLFADGHLGLIPEPLSEGVTEPASSASGGQARVVGTPSDRGPGVETREDIYLVYDRQGRYVGCIPSQTWPILLRTGLSQRPSGDMDAGVAYMDDPTEEEE